MSSRSNRKCVGARISQPGALKNPAHQQLADLGVQFLDLGFAASLGRLIAAVKDWLCHP
jgi:hypothetical protein